jgi:hypothetical protein
VASVIRVYYTDSSACIVSCVSVSFVSVVPLPRNRRSVAIETAFVEWFELCLGLIMFDE